jgi:hypothetical protein
MPAYGKIDIINENDNLAQLPEGKVGCVLRTIKWRLQRARLLRVGSDAQFSGI